MAKASGKGQASGTARGLAASALKRVSSKERVSSKGSSKNAMASASAILKAQKPNWKLAKGYDDVHLVKGYEMRTDAGPSIKKLRGKFLGEQDAGDGAVITGVNKNIRTVRIQPKSGGSAKTADIRNGKVTIVQG